MNKKTYYATVWEMPRAEKPKNLKFKDLTGQVFGKLMVLHYAGKNCSKSSLWAAQCSCEEQSLVVVRGGNLKNGHTQSCGCHMVFRATEGNTDHGLAKRGKHHYLYGVYNDILRRCYNHTRPEYARYGGRGIRVLFSGVEEFVSYVESSLGGRPDGCSLDRIDNDGNYEPGNLRWATRKTQNRNQRSNRLVTVSGKQITLAEASEQVGINYHTAYTRLSLGWSIEEAIHTPIGQKRAEPPTQQPAGVTPC